MMCQSSCAAESEFVLFIRLVITAVSWVAKRLVNLVRFVLKRLVNLVRLSTVQDSTS